MNVGTLRLGFVLLLMVLHGVYVVGRKPRYLEAGVLSSSGGLVQRVCNQSVSDGCVAFGGLVAMSACNPDVMSQ